jgi:hypothetical protein
VTQAAVEKLALQSAILRPVFDHWSNVNLPDCWLVAGSIAQTVWNAKFGNEPSFGISDIDLVYFDADDLSDEAEQSHALRINHLFRDLQIHIDVKNEARVHLWYGEKFGYPIAPYQSSKGAIDTFPTTATSIGMQPNETGLETYAPFGVDDLMNGIVRANKALISKEVYLAKVTKWCAKWPKLCFVEWD